LKSAKLLLLLLCIPLIKLLAQTKTDGESLVQVDKLKEDLLFLRKKLEVNHPNLYLYTAQQEIDKLFDSLYRTITEPLTVSGFYKHISCISSVIKDGHTIILPADKTTEYHNKHSPFLPYHFTIVENRLFIDMTCTNDTSITDGDEILSINNVSSAEIIQTLMTRQIRDGYNLTYPLWILNNFMREYYSFIFGHPETYSIRYVHNNHIDSTTIKGILKDSIYYYRKQKYPSRIIEKKPKDGLTIRFAPDNKYAILTIKDFHNDVLRKTYEQNFEKVIDNYFAEINDKRTANLILDLRNNQGGDISNGTFLLSYLLDTSFKNIDWYYKVDKSQANFTLKKAAGESLGYHEPKQTVFKGNLLVLINGGSFSNSGIVAACLKKYNRAVFIGEETGGNNKVLAGDAEGFYLPSSNILIEIPTKQYLLDATLPPAGRGTTADYTINADLWSIINNTDSVMNFAVDLIQKK
jgi:hypothetical protein